MKQPEKGNETESDAGNSSSRNQNRKAPAMASSSSVSYRAYAAAISSDDKKLQQHDLKKKTTPYRRKYETKMKDTTSSEQEPASIGISKEPASRKRYTQKSQESKEGLPPDTSSADLTNIEPSSSQYESSGVFPGAVRVAGPDRGDSFLEFEDFDAFDLEEEGAEQQESMTTTNDHFASKPPTPQDQQELTLLHAELVTSSDDGKEPVPYADAAIPIRPWKTRLGVAILVIILVGISVGIAVPLTQRSSSPSTPATLAPTTMFPSMTPTTTPAPTAQEQITVVVGLDSKPGETGWRLDCNGKNRANFPIGVYDERSANRNLTAQFPLTIGEECTFEIEDAGGDGLEDGRFFRIHFGQVYSTSATLLAEGGGNFTSKAQVGFLMEAPITSAPSYIPSSSPTTTFQPSMLPTTYPTTSFVPTSFPTQDPTPLPTPSPTPLTTQSPTTFPTSIPTIVLTANPTPGNTGGSFQPTPPIETQSPVSSSPMAPPTPFPTPAPTLSPVSAPTPGPTQRPSTAAPTPPPTPRPTRVPTRRPTLAPTASIPVQLTVILQLDAYPSETGWSMTCDGTVVKEVNSGSYGQPNQLVTQVLTTRVGASCVFEIEDSFGDGICCKFEKQGFYELYLGTDTSKNSNLIGRGGEFESTEQVVFTAREPE